MPQGQVGAQVVRIKLDGLFAGGPGLKWLVALQPPRAEDALGKEGVLGAFASIGLSGQGLGTCWPQTEPKQAKAENAQAWSVRAEQGAEEAGRVQVGTWFYPKFSIRGFSLESIHEETVMDSASCNFVQDDGFATRRMTSSLIEGSGYEHSIPLILSSCAQSQDPSGAAMNNELIFAHKLENKKMANGKFEVIVYLVPKSLMENSG